MFGQYAGSTRSAGTQTYSYTYSKQNRRIDNTHIMLLRVYVCILYYHKAIKLSCKSTVLFLNSVTRFFKGLECYDTMSG